MSKRIPPIVQEQSDPVRVKRAGPKSGCIRFNDLANRINGIVWEADPTGSTLFYVSNQIVRLLGYTQEECRVEGFWKTRIHPDDLERVVEHRKTACSDTEQVVEYRMVAKQGHAVWFCDSFSLGGSGQSAVLRGILTEINDRKHAEEAMQFADAVFDYCTDAVTVTDRHCRIQRVNAAFSAITGYHPNEIRGQTPRVLRSGVQDEGFYQAMWKGIGERGSWSGELWNRRKSGELYIQQLTIVAVRANDGEVLNYLGVARDVSWSKAAEEQIEQLAHYDAMTGLPNRAHLMTRLQAAIGSAESAKTQVAILAVDLDRLAYINDTLGHDVGDQLLVAVAERLSTMLHAGTIVFRHIGDEFTVVIEESDGPYEAAQLAERLLAELAKPFALGDHEVVVSACVGISLYPQDGQAPELLLRHADVALHDAKLVGSNKFRFFHEDMKDGAIQRLRIESSLRHALDRNEFDVHYQPQVDLQTGRITGMEALVRWQHPELGFVSPAQFIPIAEKTGAILEIGMWVTLQACAATHEWHRAGHTGLRVAVNVSAHQLAHDDFPSQIRQILAQTGLAPQSLELELTESMIMQRPERVIAILEDLRTIGVQFSIDDFGTGYSSLSQLKRFPIDKLKIDQSFTRDIGKDDNGSAITRTIIALGRSMGLKVIAEGVETEEQRAFLKENGCHGMQGYLVSRPVPAPQFSYLLGTGAGVEET